MVQITITAPVPATVPADGWRVDYRIKGTSGAFITPVGSPFTALPITFNTTDPAGTLYEVRVWRDCGALESSKFTKFTPCSCTTSGYVVDGTGEGCQKTESIPATVTNSGFCLAPSVNAVYSTYPARIYKPGFSQATVLLPPGSTDTYIESELFTASQWQNVTSSSSLGPMNREGVWVDRDCDGNRDALNITAGPLTIGAIYTIFSYQPGDDFTNVGAASNSNGTLFTATGTTPTTWTNGSILSVKETTVAFTYNNLGASRTVFVGVAGDNQFELQVNGVVIVNSGPATVSDTQFKTWHLIPVTINVGVNYFNVTALGDGSTSDSIAMAVYDNTVAQLTAATSDAMLNVLFKTSSLRGTSYDVATCPPTYNLDTSGGVGNYVCKKVLTKVCNTAT